MLGGANEVKGQPEVPAQIFQEFLAALEKADVPSDFIERLRTTIITERDLSDNVIGTVASVVKSIPDAQFQLGDLLPNATGQYRKLLKEAKKAAQSWGQKDTFISVEALEAKFTNILGQSKVEEWQINPAIHYNEWANFQKEDFAPVISSQKTLIASLHCETCGAFFYVLPERGTSESLRCDCGALNLNLIAK